MSGTPDPELDPQLLEFARRHDPARHLPDPPPVTAAQLRHRAELRCDLPAQPRAQRLGGMGRQRGDGLGRQRLWLPAVCVAVVAVIVILSLPGIVALRPYLDPGTDPGTRHPPVEPTSSATPPGQGTGPARPAPPVLPPAEGGPGEADAASHAKRILSNLASIAARQPAQTPALYAYLRRQSWAAGTTVPAAVIATDVQTWLRADFSGYEQTTTLPAQPAGGRETQWTQRLPAQFRAGITTFEPGGYPHPVRNPSPQAGVLAAQLGNAYGHEVATGVADLFRLHLSPAQHCAALHVLAGISNLAYHGTVTDRASRTGVAFSSTDPASGVREVLYLEPGTGALLAFERLAPGAGGESLVEAYTLFLETHTTNTRP